MEIIGGYKLVRRLGGGRRAEVYLAHSLRSDDSGRPKVAAIKRFRPDTPLDSIDREIEALARVSSAHLQRLDDLTTAEDGRPALILARLGPRTLADLVLARPFLAPGELVTIIAPLAEAVGVLHTAGVAHGGIRLGAVRFDDRAAPVLCGFGSATIVGRLADPPGTPSLTPAAMQESEAVLGDLADLLALTRTVAAAVHPSPERDELLDLLERMDVTAHPERIADTVTDAMFAFAEPTPVDLEPVSTDEAPTAVRRAPFRQAVSESAMSPAWWSLGLPAWLDALPVAVAPTITRLRTSFGRVRRPVWVAAGTAAVLLVGALTLVQGDRPASADSAGERSDVAATQSVAPAETPRPTPAEAEVLAADDPVAAAEVLLSLRRSCFVALSVTCLDEVVQSGSAAAEADSFALRGAQEAGAAAPAPDEFAAPALTERLGDSAILSTTLVTPRSTEPAQGEAGAPDTAPPLAQGTSPGTAPSGDALAPVTIVLMRVEGDWRLRDLIVG